MATRQGKGSEKNEINTNRPFQTPVYISENAEHLFPLLIGSVYNLSICKILHVDLSCWSACFTKQKR